MFNLELHTIHLRHGTAQETLPGLIALAPMRKCARGREVDQLVGLVDLSGKTSITPEALTEWMMKKAALFYSTPGSTTNAMRMMAESINNELLDRNLKKAADGSQVNGSLFLVVLRKNVVYSLIIGQGRIFILEGEAVIELEDHENHARGLGVNQALTCIFSQSNINSGSSVLIAPLSSPLWTPAYLVGGGALPVDVLGRRLMNQHPADMRAILLHLVDGSGKVTRSSLTRGLPAVEGVTSYPVSPVVQPEPEDALQPALIDLGQTLADTPHEAVHVIQKDEAEVSLPMHSTDKAETANLAVPSGKKAESTEVRVRKIPLAGRRKKPAMPQIDREKLKAQVGSAVEVVDEVQEKVKRGSSSIFSRLFPAEGGTPRSLLLLLAIVIPLVVVAAAGSVYLRRGRTQQFNYYYQQGQQYAIQAEAQKDDEIMRLFNLQAASMYLAKASEFGQTNESMALSVSIQAQLDAVQGVERLKLTTLNTNDVPGKVNISQMVATTNDLYLLDGISGKALRYTLSGNTYVKDDAFDCGPNPDNPLNSIGKVVDMLPLTAGNSFGATLFAIDAYGNIEFCIPGKSGTISSLIAPDAGWQGIKAISIFQNRLYVLDPGNNGVFIYPANGILFEEKPTLFFDTKIPTLSDAIDMEVNADELYILRGNGELVECTYSHIKDYKLTECADPAPYSDMRSGSEPQAINFPDAQFVQMRLTAAPDSSIYFLDTHGSSLFHFSLQRNLQKIIQPFFTDPGYRPKVPATSVAISPGKLVFMAFGNQVYSGALP